jgi:polyhydroxyalkanoate synthesis repressor PhaR
MTRDHDRELLTAPAAAVRVIKRYGSRKLYDTSVSRYVGLEELGRLVREGDVLQVIDNDSGADVTAPVLTQVILEENKRGIALPVGLLHDLVRAGAQAVDRVAGGVGDVQERLDRAVHAGLDRMGPLGTVRREMNQLRDRLDDLERAMDSLAAESPAATSEARESR